MLISRYHKKIFRVLFIFLVGYPTLFLSYFFPKSKKYWVVGSHYGFRDNAKYFYLEAVKRNDIKCFWIANDKRIFDTLKSQSLPVIYKNSCRGIIISLISKVYIYDYSLLDVNLWTSARTLKINLWHGVGIKKIQHSIKNGKSAKFFKKNNLFFRVLLPQNFIKPDLFLSTSEMMDIHFCNSFEINKDNIINAMYPRCSIFYEDDSYLKEHIKIFMPEYLKVFNELGGYSKVYIYMPTWRDSGKDIFTESGLDLNHLNSILKNKNQLLLLKLHPNTLFPQDIITGKLENILLLDKDVDIYPFLPKCDVLITDYSSIYYDFILMSNKKFIFFLYDFDIYRSQERDLAFDFHENTVGVKVYNSKDLMREFNDDTPLGFHDVNEIKYRFWNKSNKKCLDQVHNYIFCHKRQCDN